MRPVLDFYGGVGGWALGFQLAGLTVREHYEWWPTALETYNANFAAKATPIDVRTFDFDSLPSRVDYIVGSPPCTQFSFANRGGSGDISDGLVDVRRFLQIVERLKPRNWAMENVPRVAHILSQELAPGGSLASYKKLFSTIAVVKMEEFGLPQRRRRMIAGKFDDELLLRYRANQPKRTLGQVLKALATKVVRDPLYGIQLRRSDVSGLEREEPLSEEEMRMNREAKAYHPVYNVMAFPDPLNRPSRTVTATCTRVSRESIVIADPENPGLVRRLSVRERASLQGFPITFEFHGESHSDRLKMVGNAIPPVMTYFLAHAFRGTRPEKVPALDELTERIPRPQLRAPPAQPDRVGSRYPEARKFQAAIHGLRFGSGMRFELSNAADGGRVAWSVRFFFGGSKKYRQIVLDHRVIELIQRQSSWGSLVAAFREAAQIVDEITARTNPELLQQVWVHRAAGVGPYDVADELGRAADLIARAATDLKPVWIANIAARLAAGSQSEALSTVSRKFSLYNSRVLAGLLIGSHFNASFEKQVDQSGVARRAAR